MQVPATGRGPDGQGSPHRPLRVAVVTETYPPEVNGVAATVERVVEGLRQRGHAVPLVRPRQAADAADAGVAHAGSGGDLLVRGLPIPRYPGLKMGVPAQRALLARWRQQRPDVVHLVTEGPLGWSALLAARRLGLPVVSDFRTNFHAYSRHYGMAWLHGPIMACLRSFHNRTACTMVPTEALREQLAGVGFQRLQVLARGVDTVLFNPARRSAALRAQWGADEATPVVLSVGRLAPEKNLGALVDTWRAMQARAGAGPLKLVLVGDGPARAALQAQLPEAHFAGLRRGEDLAAHYASADIFLFTSLTETFGNVVPEAMASALAVLAFDDAAAAQLIRHGESGLLAPPGDAQALRAHAQALVQAPAQVARLGFAARTVAERHGWARIVEQVEAVYAAVARADAEPAAGLALQPALRP